VIGKVIRGTNVQRLLYYLFGPGKANEHVDPRLVGGFSDPAELEPERRRDGSADVRRLAGLLNQPLAALRGPGFDKPVWHCSVRAAPGDRELSDEEWAQVAALVMDKTGLAPDGDDVGVRWVAVRHAADHVHLVATLARQDGARPKVWNDFFRVREACLEAEQRLGLAVTAPADRTAARRPSRAEAERSARDRRSEVPRDRLRREVCAAAGGARTEQDFFGRLEQAGVLIRLRYSTINPDQVTGFAVGLPDHTARDGGTIWYSGGKLAADLTLPKLRTRWTAATDTKASPLGAGLPPPAAKAALRALMTKAARQSSGEAGFFEALRAEGVLVRLRFSEMNPGEVTGYSVALPGQSGPDGHVTWYGGGKLAERLSLPRLRSRWNTRTYTPASSRQAPSCTAAERDAIFRHAAQQASDAAARVRWWAGTDPAQAADAAYAAADVLRVAAQLTGSRVLHQAASAYERAARAPFGRIPHHTSAGNQLRGAARLLALTGRCAGRDVAQFAVLAVRLAGVVEAVCELRMAQRHAAQAAACRRAAERLRTVSSQFGQAAPGRARSGQLGPPTLAAKVTQPSQPGSARNARVTSMRAETATTSRSKRQGQAR
jgi:hypothetical protein